MDKIKIGVIGVGNMGKNHVRLLTEMKEDYELCGVYDLDKEKVLKTGHAGRIYDSAEELMSDVEAVVVAAPSFLHKQLALQAAEHNLHLLMEKPLSLGHEDAEEVCRRYEQIPDKILMVGHVERFNPVVQELGKILNDEEVLAVTIERCSPTDLRISDTDVIYDLMIHDVDILLNAILPGKKIEELYAIGRTSYNEKYLDYVQAIFKFDNKVQASIVASRTTEEKIRKIKIHCKGAFINCDLLHKSIVISRRTHFHLDTGYSPIYKQENITEHVFVPNVEPLRKELSYFSESIRTGNGGINSGKSASLDLQVLDRIQELVY